MKPKADHPWNRAKITRRVQAHAFRKPVWGINEQGESLFLGKVEEAAFYGIHKSGVSACLNGKQHTAGGYRWYEWLDGLPPRL